MRLIVLLSLLILTACTIREETFSSRDYFDVDGLAINPPEDLNTPLAAGDDSRACPGGFARGSRIDEDRDGSINLFCN